jgi:PAS domain S-box-containing protein
MRKLSVSGKLFLLVFIMSAFIISIGAYLVLQMRIMERNTKTIYVDDLLPIDYLTTMRYSYKDGIQNTLRSCRDQSITEDSAKKKLRSEQKKIDSCWTAYRGTYLTPPEIALISTTGPMIAHADTAIGKLLSDDLDENNTADMTDLNGTLALLMPNLQSLVKLQVKVSDEFYRKNQSLYWSTSKNFTALAMWALIVAIALCIFIIRDISRLVSNLEKSNNSLAESEEKYRYLFDNTPMIMTIWDPETSQVLELNKKAAEAYGSDRDEQHQLASFQAQQQQDMQGLQGFIKEMLANNSTFSRKIWHQVRHDGEVRYMDIISHRIMYNDRPALLAIIEDVTQQYQSEENMKKMNEQIKGLNERLQAARENELAYLATEIHDELGQYITLLRTDISWIDQHIHDPGPSVRERFARIYEHLALAADNIRRIISHIRPPS